MNIGVWIAIVACIVGVVVATMWALRLRKRLLLARGERDSLLARFGPIVDLEAERQSVASRLSEDRARANADAEAARASAAAAVKEATDRRAASLEEATRLEARMAELRSEVMALDEQATLQSFGFYQKQYDFPTALAFDAAIAQVEQAQKTMVKQGHAAICTTHWTVEGSEKKGEMFIKRILTLMLRAFNGECDAAIARVKYNNVAVMESRIHKCYDAINKLATINQCLITEDYQALRLKELHLVHEQREKLQAEREEQREIREQMREEEIARREMEKARLDAEHEEERYSSALSKARLEVATAEGSKQQKLVDKIADLERLLAEARANKERAISRAQLTRSGHVYVISNIGSFGEHIYKIGMTRRLDPMDRIHELSDASVPFAFDVHAVIYCDDAPSLENELHRVFDAKRLNMINMRKEFFCVTLDEISDIVRARQGDILITKLAAAEEYRKTTALLAEHGEIARGWGHYDRRSTRTAHGSRAATVA
jgi:multidrug efflux pump subunit AcrA (membrane-fusion protein)